MTLPAVKARERGFRRIQSESGADSKSGWEKMAETAVLRTLFENQEHLFQMLFYFGKGNGYERE